MGFPTICCLMEKDATELIRVTLFALYLDNEVTPLNKNVIFEFSDL